ncbi:MAG: GTP 3',8-cyclase MoaA [Acidimicrobiia bacterium]|nr:GTP 3',8-cyclase MoaA [Acidimicrobiia bacterium]
MTPLLDGFGRRHTDLRLSVTDRCNFRCTYCMPAEGMQFRPRSELLTYEEIERLTRLLVERYGITSIRLTGGEPTVRAHLPVLVAKLARLGVDLALTTNGATLGLVAGDLADAGLQRINISLDSLRRDRFAEITRRDGLADVLAGIDAAVAAGLSPVKINCVVAAGVNDDEVVDFAAFGRERGVTVRFIEFMPLDADGGWRPADVVSAEQIVERIDAVFPLEEAGGRGSAPAERWRYRDGAGEVGIIPTVTKAFCSTCDRIRLTADGQFRTCLFAHDEYDLRGALRGGADDDALAQIIEGAVTAKWAGHGIGTEQFIRPPRSMSQIGG